MTISSTENNAPRDGYIVRVVNRHGDFWLGQRVYRSYDSSIIVKHNLMDAQRYDRVYVLPATAAQHAAALSIVD